VRKLLKRVVYRGLDSGNRVGAFLLGEFGRGVDRYVFCEYTVLYTRQYTNGAAMVNPPETKAKEQGDTKVERVLVTTSDKARRIAEDHNTTKQEIYRFLVDLADDCGLDFLIKLSKRNADD